MFLEEGFSDFVAKPIETSALERVLRKYIPANKIVRIEEAAGYAPKAEEMKEKEQTKEAEPEKEEFAEWEGVDTELGLSYCGGEPQDYLEIVQIYYISGKEKRNSMEEAYEQKNWKDYAILVHALKSTSLGIGIVKLSEMAKELEMAAKKEDEEYILAHHADTMKEYDKMLHILSLMQG